MRARHGDAGEQGQSMVEFALALPIMLIIVTGICAFGITISHYMILTDATNVGGRQLAIIRGSVTDACSTVSQTIAQSASTLTAGSLTYKFVLNGNTTSGAKPSCVSDTSDLLPGQTVQVTVTYSACSLAFFGTNYSPSCTIQAQATELEQ
ncbi:MAG TPA: TadE/TadG family type IV pilus assembly protein [Acidobacteriaceae bacterium]